MVKLLIPRASSAEVVAFDILATAPDKLLVWTIWNASTASIPLTNKTVKQIKARHSGRQGFAAVPTSLERGKRSADEPSSSNLGSANNPVEDDAVGVEGRV